MPNPILTEAIDRLSDGVDLDPSDASRVLTEIIEGNASEAQAAAFLISARRARPLARSWASPRCCVSAP
jgi:anthranilate phosphoribosyltransferase